MVSSGTAPMDLVNGFRVMSIVAVSVFWVALGIILGLIWEKFRPLNSIKKEKKVKELP